MRLSCLLQHHLYGDNLPGCLVFWHTSLYTVFISGIHGHAFMCMYNMQLYCFFWIGMVINKIPNCDSRALWIAILRLTDSISARRGVLIAGRQFGFVCFVSAQYLHEQCSVPGMELQHVWDHLSVVLWAHEPDRHNFTAGYGQLCSFSWCLSAVTAFRLVKEEIISIIFFFFAAVSIDAGPSVVCSSSAAASRQL